MVKYNNNIIKNSTIMTQNKYNKLYNYKNKWVIKSINIKKSKNLYDYNYKNEYNILSNLNNPNIIRCYGGYYDKSNYNIILPYYKYGDFHEYFFDNEIYHINTIIKKLVKPIYYLHQNNIIHLDLKLENFVISNNKDLVLIDFEYAKKNQYQNYYQLIQMKNIIGTRYFIAPEIMKYYKYCYSSDIYSLGCIIYTILYKDYIKDSNNIELHFIKDPKLKYIVSNMLEYNSSNRPTITEIKDYIDKEL